MTEEKKENAPAPAATTPPAPAQTPPGWTYSMGTSQPWGSVSTDSVDKNKPLQERIVDVMKTVYDPEIPVNIYELGMVYELKADETTGDVFVKMTLTTPACPVAGSLPPEVERRLRAQPGVKNVKLELVWEPAWNPQMMSEAAKLKLGFL